MHMESHLPVLLHNARVGMGLQDPKKEKAKETSRIP